MNEKTLSIIIPSYKTSRFISNYPKYYKHPEIYDDIDILFIDDGSNDDTGVKLKEFCKTSPTCFHYIYKENGGHGSVINLGSCLANSKYFKVIDGDDYPDLNSLLKLALFLKKTDSDVVITDYVCNYVEKREQKLSEAYAKDVIDSTDVSLLNKFSLAFHNMTYRTAFWRENNIKIREHVFYDDTEYLMFPLPFVKKFSYLKLPLYVYSIGIEGQSVSYKSMVKHYNDHKQITKDLFDFYDTNYKNGDGALDSFYSSYLGNISFFNYFRLLLVGGTNLKKDVKDFYLTVKKYPAIFALFKQNKVVKYSSIFNFAFLKIISKHYINKWKK
jgi:glycosyltransferase involved in cell wall biosynthesis